MECVRCLIRIESGIEISHDYEEVVSWYIADRVPKVFIELLDYFFAGAVGWSIDDNDCGLWVSIEFNVKS